MSNTRQFLFACLASLALLSTTSIAFAHGSESHDEASVEADRINASGNGSESIVSPVDRVGMEPVEDGGVIEPVHTDAGFVDVLRALHPATVHFPIAFFLLAGLFEALALARRRPEYSSTSYFLILAGTVGACVAALFGWIHTGLWFGGEIAMHWHRWIGSGVALAGLVMLLLLRWQKRGAVRLLLAFTCAALVVQGYLGGELAHGPNHLTGSH